MPRLTKKHPAYRLHKASGQAVVTMGGRDIYVGPFGTPESESAYDLAISRWLANGRRSTPPPTTPPPSGASDAATIADLTVSELLVLFLDSARDHYRRRDGSFAPEFDNLLLAIKPLKAQFGSVPAKEFRRLKLFDRSGDSWKYEPSRHKTARHGKTRSVFFGPQAREILRTWLRANADEFLFQPLEAKEEHLAERKRNRKRPLTPSQRARKRKARPRKAPGIGIAIRPCHSCRLVAFTTQTATMATTQATTALP